MRFVIPMKKINKQQLRSFFEKILSEVFVDRYNCLVCDKELQEPSDYGLCRDCLGKLEFLDDRICKKCGRLQINEADYCLTCQNHRRDFDFARSCVAYDDNAKEIVRGLKFGSKKYYAKYVSYFLSRRFEECFGDISVDAVVPVPLTKQRLRERGYNQAYVIAEKFAERLDLPLRSDLVVKVRQNLEQAKLSGKEREENVVGAYSVALPQEVAGKRLLIIDDVLTTGSTLGEIAAILKKAKASAVYALTFAGTRYRVDGEKLESDEVKS